MIHFSIPSIPPSSNHAYFQRGPVRALSTAGQAYKKETTAYITKKHTLKLKEFRPNKPYLLYILLHMPNLLNQGWPENCKTRYKKQDISNRVKLLEDVLAEVTNVDDSNYETVIARKIEGTEKTDIWYWDIEAEGSPFHDGPFYDL